VEKQAIFRSENNQKML